MQAKLSGSVSGRYCSDENSLLTKHVVAAGRFAKDAGSTPAASTTLSTWSSGAFVFWTHSTSEFLTDVKLRRQKLLVFVRGRVTTRAKRDLDQVWPLPPCGLGFQWPSRLGIQK